MATAVIDLDQTRAEALRSLRKRERQISTALVAINEACCTLHPLESAEPLDGPARTSHIDLNRAWLRLNAERTRVREAIARHSEQEDPHA